MSFYPFLVIFICIKKKLTIWSNSLLMGGVECNFFLNGHFENKLSIKSYFLKFPCMWRVCDTHNALIHHGKMFLQCTANGETTACLREPRDIWKEENRTIWIMNLEREKKLWLDRGFIVRNNFEYSNLSYFKKKISKINLTNWQSSHASTHGLK